MKLMRLAVTVLFVAVWVFPGPALAGDRVLFYHNDALGSPVVMTDSAGNVAWRADYEPFGEISALVDTLQAPNTHQFIGKDTDLETSLHYLGARYYDGNIGRFLSQDPALSGGMPNFTLSNPQYLNRYGYGLNSPYKYVDPKGRVSILATLLFVGAVYGVYHAYQTLNDPNASTLQRELAVGGAVLGVVGSGGVSGAIKITEKGLAHALERHGAESVAADASKFAKGVDIPELIRKAEAVAPAQAKGDNLQRIVNAGETIGTDRTTGQATSTYTVITDKLNNFRTTHPGRPDP